MSMRTVNLHAAGIDLGSEKIFVSVEDQAVKVFDTFTESYYEAARYLTEHGITTVAMEATGVLWMPLYDILEARGIEVYVVNARHVKHLPGRKSDVADCQWIQELHTHGLLHKSFIPQDNIRQLRSYTRLKEDHISMASQHILHMQKAFDLMNVKFHTVISSISGASGLRVVRAILQGERDPEELLSLCDVQIRQKKRDKVLASLKGNYRKEYLFQLQQALEGYDFYQKQIEACDKNIEHLFEEITRDLPPPKTSSKAKKSKRHSYIPNLHDHLMRMTGGTNPSKIPGFTDERFMRVIGEVGTDMNAWKTKKQYVSWMGTAPNMHQSGKSNKKRRRKVKSRAGQIFRLAALSLAKSNTAYGSFYRRIKARRGAAIAMKATARKLAGMYYDLMTKGIEYVEQGIEQYEQQLKEQQLRSLEKRARKMGFVLAPERVVL
jgi:transposase